MELTPEIIFALLQSSDSFPVDFDDAMTWWDCRTRSGRRVPKGDLKEKLQTNFFQDSDFVIFASEISEANQRGGHNKEVIRLTVECFKMLGMMLPGSRGREIRQYFIDCETELKRRLAEDAQTLKQRIVRAFVSEKVESRLPRFKDEFYELLYAKRGQGWEKRNPKDRPSCVGTWTNQVVYDRFPEGVKDRLNEVNPRIDGRRKDRHHWHLKTMGSVHLEGHLPAVMAVARISPDGDWDKFMRNIQKAFPNGEALQLSLFDYLEEMESEDKTA